MGGKAFEAGKPAPPEAASAGGDATEAAKSPENRPDVEVTFLYVFHTPENVGQIWEKAEDADLILLEFIATKGKRKELESCLNALAQIPPDHPRAEALRQYHQLAQQEFLDQFATYIAGSGKEIRFIDETIETEEDSNPRSGRLEACNEELHRLLRNGDVEEALRQYPGFIKALAEDCRRREGIVIKQLEEWLGKIQGKKKVAVIQGAQHTPVYHFMKKGGYHFRGRYLPVPSPLSYPSASTILRKRLFFPERKISKEEYRRSFFCDTIVLWEFSPAWPNDIAKAIAASVRLTAKLSDEEIDRALDRFAQEQQAAAADIDCLWPDEIAKGKKIRAQAKTALGIVRDLAQKHGLTLSQKRAALGPNPKA